MNDLSISRGICLIGLLSVLVFTACSPNLTGQNGSRPAAEGDACPPIDRTSSQSIFAFGGNLNEQHAVYLAEIGGDSVKMLSDAIASSSCPAFSPDGLRLAFCSDSGDGSRLFIMCRDGSSPHPLTDKIKGCSCGPDAPLSWSPDGSWIMLPIQGEDRSQPIYDIFIVSSNDGQVINLTSAPQRYGGLVWDADSQSIYFAGKIGEISDIYRMDIINKTTTPLTGKPINGAPMGWSSDGSQLLYFADSGDGNFEIYLLNRGEDQPMRLTDAQDFDTYPQWFPDGRHILFVSKRDGDNEIYRMDADGSHQENLTNDPHAMDIWPSISSDGQHIIYLTSRGDQWDSWVMNADGSDRQKLTELIGLPGTVSWLP